MMAEVLEIGPARLYRADCLDVMSAWPPNWIDMIWTDPPYGHGNNDGDLNASLRERGYDGFGGAIANDTPDTMRQVVDGMLTQAARVLKRDCCCCCCCCCCGGGGGPRPTFAWLAGRMDQDGLDFFHSVIWDKVNPGLGWRYRRQHEMVMVAHRSGGKLRWPDNRLAIGNVLKMAAPANRRHPNEKPLPLVCKFIEAHTARGDTVLDPFMGSGTTGVAAVRLGRRFIGIETDPQHFETARGRIAKTVDQGELFGTVSWSRQEQVPLEI